jgi:hypothetical protein
MRRVSISVGCVGFATCIVGWFASHVWWFLVHVPLPGSGQPLLTVQQSNGRVLVLLQRMDPVVDVDGYFDGGDADEMQWINDLAPAFKLESFVLEMPARAGHPKYTWSGYDTHFPHWAVALVFGAWLLLCVRRRKSDK